MQFKPTLKGGISDKNYGQTFNMNGTIELPGVGTVYSCIKGRDKSEMNFGSFATLEGKAYLGNAGILMLNDFKTLVFPTPFRISGNKITGDTYEIKLNDGWAIEKDNETGDYLIKKTNSLRE